MTSAPNRRASSSPTRVLPVAVAPERNQHERAKGGQFTARLSAAWSRLTLRMVSNSLSAWRFQPACYCDLIGSRCNGKSAALTPTRRILDQLLDVIRDRKANPSESSYTCQLFAGGVPRIGAKVTEEAAETVEAAAETDAAGRQHLIAEAADLVYHLLVLLAARDVDLADVEAELANRFGISGLEEKASRSREP